MLADGLFNGELPAGVVHCWSLDHADAEHLTTEQLLAAQQTGVLSALHLVQVLAPRGLEAPTRVWMITRDAQPVVDGDRCSRIASSPIAGWARVANNEHFAFRWTVIDLDRENSVYQINDLHDEITIGDEEVEVAYRNGRRYANRLHHVSIAELPSRTTDAVRSDGSLTPYRLQTKEPGTLSILSLNETQRREPGPNEVEVRVRAGGVNFHDVMKAWGMYPGNPIDLLWFGDDFSGTVQRVGADVRDFRPGDEVVGMAPYSFRAYNTVDRRLLFKKPLHMSFAEAATLPTVFLTTHYALNHLARMQVGEAILIHAGTGGVGQAAIQIAQHLGLEVFATAGTPEKREMLREMGVPHVMNSRTLDFADNILAITGGRGVDAVLNSLAGDFIPKSFSVLAPFGRFLEIGKIDVYGNTKIGLQQFRENISYFVIDLAQHLEHRPQYVASMFAELVERFAVGDYHPLSHRVFPITEVVDAFRYMAQGKHVGKNVLSFDVDHIPIGPCTEDGHLFRAEATYLITGGVSGFGLELAKWLAAQGARHLVLVSRSGPRDDEAAADIEALRADGIHVLDARADVTKMEEVRRVIDQISDELPPLAGVIHGAMVLDDAFLVELNEERFNCVLQPKMLGAWNLHVATLDLPLELFMCLSSFSTVVGAVRQSNYNAGNYFLEMLAHHRRGLGLPAVTYDWAALAGAGFVERNEKTAQYLDKVGLKSLTMKEAFGVIRCTLGLDPVQIAACRADWQSFARFSPMIARSNMFASLTAGQTESTGGSIGQRILATPAHERTAIVEDFIAEQVAAVVSIDVGQVDRETFLTDLGLDSLMAIDLIHHVESELAISLPVGNVLSGSNVKDLAEIVMRLIADSGEASATSQDVQATAAGSSTPLKPLPRQFDEFPLLPRQRTLQHQAGRAPVSLLSIAGNFRSSIDADYMQRALDSVVARHPMLRVTLGERADGPVYRQQRQLSCWVGRHDATQLSHERLRRLIDEHAGRPMDPTCGPLISLDVYHTAESADAVLLCLHPLVADVWSLGILLSELIGDYASFEAGRKPQLKSRSLTFQDVVVWEHGLLAGDRGRQMLEYWKGQLDGASLPFCLPGDRARSCDATTAEAIYRFKLEESLAQRLLTLSAEQDVTLRTTLSVALAVLLHRCTARSDVVMSCWLDGRKDRELLDVVGPLSRPVALRTRTDDNPTFSDLLQRTARDLLRQQTSALSDGSAVRRPLQP